jgi:hypothetical protein
MIIFSFAFISTGSAEYIYDWEYDETEMKEYIYQVFNKQDGLANYSKYEEDNSQLAQKHILFYVPYNTEIEVLESHVPIERICSQLKSFRNKAITLIKVQFLLPKYKKAIGYVPSHYIRKHPYGSQDEEAEREAWLESEAKKRFILLKNWDRIVKENNKHPDKSIEDIQEEILKESKSSGNPEQTPREPDDKSKLQPKKRTLSDSPVREL